MGQEHLHVVESYSKCCFWCQTLELVTVRISPTAFMKSSKLTHLHSNFQLNMTEDLTGPTWKGRKHTNRTKGHADQQRPEQRAKAESPPLRLVHEG